MKNLNALMTNLINDESGQDLIEYALAACLIGLACVAAMGKLANSIGNAFTSIGTQLTNAV